MSTKPIVAGSGVIVILAMMAVTLVSAYRPPQVITVRRVNSVRSGDSALLTFELTNHTTRSYELFPLEVQVRIGSEWRQCFDCRKPRPKVIPISPRASASYTCQVTNLPTASPLRFSVTVEQELPGLFGLYRRITFRVQGDKTFPLNPFDRRSRVFGVVERVVSEEFVQPEGK